MGKKVDSNFLLFFWQLLPGEQTLGSDIDPLYWSSPAENRHIPIKRPMSFYTIHLKFTNNN